MSKQRPCPAAKLSTKRPLRQLLKGVAREIA
jgi:hypothetical protein